MREIRALPVKCDNLERGCDWLGTVGDLEDHLTKCGSSPVPCPNKCKVDHLQLLRKSLKDHLETKCPNRAYSCEHCGLKGKYASIVGEHNKKCEKKLVSCPNKCAMTMKRGEMKKHIQTVCKFTEVACKYHSIGCKVRKMRMWMNQHEEEDDKAHLHMSLEMITKIDRKLSFTLEKTAKLENTLSLQVENTAKLLEKLDSTPYSMKVDGHTFGLITFKMSEYGKKMEGNVVFYSQPFYSGPSGYRMCIKVYPNGFAQDKGSHVSVYLKLLEGPNDKSLHWPILGTGKLELLNQSADGCHHVRTLTLDTTRNIGPCQSTGYSKFLPHSELSHDSARNTQYLMDDTLYFRVTVTVGNPKPWLICTRPPT